MVRMSQKTTNLGVVAVCDLWKLNREKAAADCRTRFGAEVKQFKYSEDMLAMPDLDAVMIATGDHTCIRGKDGTLYAQGGEGSPRWFFIPERVDDAFDLYRGFEEAVKKGRARPVTLGEKGEMPPVSQSDDSTFHLENWVDCIRNPGRQPNGHIHTGFWHSIGTIMATRAYRDGRKLYWDRRKEEIVDQPVV